MGESGHWYRPDGSGLVLEVPYKDPKRSGEMKSTTLREARELGLFPSVTTIMGILAKPGLDIWKTRQAVKAALLYGHGLFESDEARMTRIVEASEEYAREAAEFGTEVHGAFSYDHNGSPFIHTDPVREQVAQGLIEWVKVSPLQVERSEHHFVSKLGFAGTLDVLGTWEDKPVIADFKTQEFEATAGPLGPNHYDDHAMQFAGYDIGTRETDEPVRGRLSIYISRTRPGLVVPYLWPAKDNLKWDARFLALWELWKVLKDYYPGGQEWLSQHPQSNPEMTSESSQPAVSPWQTSSSPTPLSAKLRVPLSPSS